METQCKNIKETTKTFMTINAPPYENITNTKINIRKG
jgi:hypothetical protein